ncbi:MAG: Sodium/hydrogen exchanger [Candidatus Woesebacteria bacterium GW2011_GWB1_43_14]|uniref:Sodium/hydrogen exchanger n=1 Tax=Candidatus Woesebacteria bacterium GW2011_GWB1_43_14 TaxID=1618578 RepID=A0A0G1DGH9_9BACT|nr:MAG: sodium/hydrogen exchanger, monovalent cation:H+ antiporter-2, CPA2 family [Candidatus Woesebacteria bacterium GW2011_GWC1_42_9]KKS97005.1 MAG: Sodium/hydrogen exchanger [Candidatus Woesebacteria bacterium GW2011_GWB1_43_14]
MDKAIIGDLFFILLAALLGGVAARILKLPTLLGYIVIGVLLNVVLPIDHGGVESVAQIGVILLLFSVGIELSLSKFVRVGYVAVLGALVEMAVVTGVVWAMLTASGFEGIPAMVFALAFSLSSTALVVKILEDRAETDSIHGEIMIGWLLTQDLAVIPIMAILPTLTDGMANWGGTAVNSLLVSAFLVSAVFFLGRMLAPALTHIVASTNSRELMVLVGISLALGTAFLVSNFGISPALGAFLAGVVISDTQENHAIFSETRPLRDVFVILFFVTLGFFITPAVLIHKIGFILSLAILVILIKALVILMLMLFLGYRGKTAMIVSFGMSQVGEFSFVIFLAARSLNILSEEYASIGIATALATLIATPFIYKLIVPLWRRLKRLSGRWPVIGSIVSPGVRARKVESGLKDHVVICGFGRMGSWIGKALDSEKIPYVVIDYNQRVVKQAQRKGIRIIYGDPAEPNVLDSVSVSEAKAVVVAIPDLVVQEEIISYCQNQAKKVKVIARAHLDEDVAKLSHLRVKKVVQPEFEAAVTVVRDIFTSMGKSHDETGNMLRALRRLHTVNSA